MSQQPPSNFFSNFVCIIAIMLFALGFPILEILLDTWGVVSIATIRNILAFFLIFSIWVGSEGYHRIFCANWKLGCLIGATGFGMGSLLLVIAQSLTSPVVAALAAAMMPLAAVFLEIFFDSRKLNPFFLIGLVLVLLGGIVSIGSEVRNIEFGVGLLVALFSVSSFAWGSRAAVKNLPNITTLEQTVVTTFGMTCFSILIYIICLLLKLPFIRIPTISIEDGYYIIVYSWLALGISQLLWIRGVYNLGIGIASFHLNLTPFYVMLILFIGGHDWIWYQALGAIIVTVGVLFSQQKTNYNSRFFKN
jgi:drug/metabolite transporter (DMT)-like permease